MPRHRRLGDRPHRSEARAGIVLGDHDDEGGHRETDESAPEERARSECLAGIGAEIRPETAEHQKIDDGDRHDRQEPGDNEPLIEGAHDRLVLAQLDEEGAYNRRHDAGGADRERVEQHGFENRLAREEDRPENHGCDDRHGVGLEEVGRHAGAVPDIVADIVRDGRGIARIVLRNARLDLSDEVAADIGTLCEDAAAETREDRDQRGAESERDEGIDDIAARRRQAGDARQIAEIERHAEEREPRDEEARHRPRLEGDVESLPKGMGRGLRGADIGPNRDVHPDEARNARKDRADRKADRDAHAKEICDDDKEHYADDGDGRVLAAQIRLRTLGDRPGDLLHALRAGIPLHHVVDGPEAIGDRQEAAQNNQE